MDQGVEKKAARAALDKAIASKDIVKIRKAIQRCEEAGVKAPEVAVAKKAVKVAEEKDEPFVMDMGEDVTTTIITTSAAPKAVTTVAPDDVIDQGVDKKAARAALDKAIVSKDIVQIR